MRAQTGVGRLSGIGRNRLHRQPKSPVHEAGWGQAFSLPDLFRELPEIAGTAAMSELLRPELFGISNLDVGVSDRRKGAAGHVWAVDAIP